MSNKDIFQGFLNTYDSYIVTAHANPDADALGSVLAIYRYLRLKHKQAYIVLDAHIPYNLQFLLKEVQIVSLEESGEYIDRSQAVIVLDCSNKQRTIFPDNSTIWQKKILNIDHHPDNGFFGSENIHSVTASSTGEMIFDLIYEDNQSVGVDILEAIYAAIIGDTGGFRYANTNSKVLNVAAKLLEYNINPAYLARKVLEDQTKKGFNLLRDALNTVKFYDNIATMQIKYEILDRHQILQSELPELVNYIRSIEGIEIAILFLEPEKNLTKVSLRSQPPIDISKVARYFGGGGHKNAAGCKIRGDFDENIQKVNQQLKQLVVKEAGKS